MKKRSLLGLTAITSVFFIWAGYAVHARELKHDATAAKQLEIIRRNLSSLTEMKSADANKNFKARTLYFKAKALLGKGDIATAKGVVAELRLIEPRAADAFGNELSGTIRIGEEAPTFNVTDIDGKPTDLPKYKGNVIIINFWATWCDPCVQEFPNVKKMYTKFKDKGVQFIGVSLDDDIEDLRGFVNQLEVEWPQVFDKKRWLGAIPSLYH